MLLPRYQQERNYLQCLQPNEETKPNSSPTKWAIEPWTTIVSVFAVQGGPRNQT